MAKDPSRPNSWKGEDRSALPGGKKSGPSSQYAWKPAAASGSAPTRQRNTKVIMLTFVGSIFLAGLVALILLLRAPKQICVAVVAGDFRPAVEDLSLPLNIYGDRGARDFLDWAKTGDRASRDWCNILGKRPLPWPLEAKNDWVAELNRRTETRIIVYVAQPGGTNEQGDAFLFDEKGNQIKFIDILKDIRGIDKQKLLVVDATQTPTDWQHGLLFNDFAEGLKKKEVVEAIQADSHLLVLCASGPGERSWVSEDLGCSVFTHYLIEGLTRAPAQEGDKITAADLYAYIGGEGGQVNQWVQRNRADRGRPFKQIPMLLPENAEATDRAKRFELAYRDPEPAKLRLPTLKDEKLGDLKKAWAASDELAKSVPAPWVYTPRLWHRYTGLLLRYEQLLRAGEDGAADQLKETIAKLNFRINEGRKVDAGETLTASLAQPAALGRDVKIDEPKLDRLCRNPLPPLEKFVADLKATAPEGTDQAVIQVHYFAHLLKLLRENKDALPLKETWERIKIIDDGGKNRPAEAHLAVMLAAHNQPGWNCPPDDLLRLAIETRILAEQTALSITPAPGIHPYSERLPQFLIKSVEAADAQRRRGEDLLFCAVSDQKDAQQLLTEAKQKYQEVQKEIEPVRYAMEVRDRLYARMPGLTDWVAIDRIERPKEVPELRDSAARISKAEWIWLELHSLASRVGPLDPLDKNSDGARVLIGVPPGQTDMKTLQQQAEQLNNEYLKLENLYIETARDHSRGKSTSSQSVLQEMENCLIVPGLLAAQQRVDLLKRLRENSAVLADPSNKTASSMNVPITDEADHLKRATGRLGRAVLGKVILDKNAVGNTSLVAQSSLTNDAAADLGRHLGAHWQYLIKEADREFQTDKSTVALPWREQLGLVAGTARDLPKDEASLEARNARWKGTYERLAKRAELDQWFNEVALPFSDELAARFLRPLRPAEDWKDLVRKLRDRREPGKLKISPPPELILTTHKTAMAQFKIGKLIPELDPGFAAVGHEIQKQDFVSVAGSIEPQRRNVANDVEEKIQLTTMQSYDTIKQAQQIKLRLSAFYRGQVAVGGEASIRVDPIPDLIVSRPPPTGGAQVAVRADERLDLGSIAIVFDCSGSMKATTPTGTKFEDAKRELKKYLKEIPAGTHITLWVYGHIKGDKHWADPGVMLLEEKSWDADNKVMSGSVYQKIEDLPAEGYTPLLQTMKNAANHLKTTTAEDRRKTLLVISDGCDNIEGNDPSPAHTQEIAQSFRAEFVPLAKQMKLSVHMMLFQVGNDKKSADVQFPEKLVQDIGNQSNRWEPQTGKDLGELLADSVRPRIDLYYRDDLIRRDRPLFAMSAKKSSWEWYPSPPLTDFGEYEARGRDLKAKLDLHGGDRLALRLTKTATGIGLVRQVVAEFENSGITRIAGLSRDDPYVMGMLGRLESHNAKLSGKFTLEDRGNTRAARDLIKYDRPEFVWWELKPIGTSDLPAGSRVTTMYEQPAPTWELACDNWPPKNGAPSTASITVWARQSMPPSADHPTIEPRGVLEKQPIDRDRAIMSAGFEPFHVPGVGDVQDCLVVRIESREGRRYLVSVTDNTKAEVHKYYFASKSSTSAFVLPTDAKNRKLFLNLISIDDAKADTANTSRLNREPLE